MAAPIEKENVLQRIPSPEVAVAETQQRMTTSTLPIPRGVCKPILHGVSPHIRKPHEHSANYFKELHSGYLCAQFVNVAEFATEPLKILTAETQELNRSIVEAQNGKRSVDDSLPARRVGIWLLADYGGYSCRSIDLLLDCLSTWSLFKVSSERVATKVRMSAMFGVDAKFILESISSELFETVKLESPGDTIVLVRWNDGAVIRSAFRKFDHTKAFGTLTNAMECLQDNVVRMSGVYDIPLPSVCMKPVNNELLLVNSFYHNVIKINDEFADLIVGNPSITFSKETVERNASRILQPTGCFVRVVNKALGKEGFNHPSCFHGAVLGFSHKRSESVRFIEESNDEHGIRIPISKYELQCGLHLCAVQAEGMQLNNLVSLYGSSGIAGKSIHQPGSWLWVARPAVRPLDAMLMNVFSLIPCKRETLIPLKQELVPGFERFWQHTTNIFKMIEDGKVNTHESILRPRSPSPTSIAYNEVSDKDAAMLALMKVDMKSERTTLGDAYAQLAPHTGMESICENMKMAMSCLHNGPRASLYDMFVLNQQSISNSRNMDSSKRKSEECLMQLCEVAINIASDNQTLKKVKTVQPLCLSAERVRRILKVISLKGSTYCTIDESGTQTNELVHTFHDIVTTSTWTNDTDERNESLAQLIKKPFVSAMTDASESNSKESFLTRIERAVALSSAVAIVASQCVNSLMFLVVGMQKNEEVYIKQVKLNGQIEPSSVDDIIRLTNPKVIVLQELTDKKIRISATKRAD